MKRTITEEDLLKAPLTQREFDVLRLRHIDGETIDTIAVMRALPKTRIREILKLGLRKIDQKLKRST